MFRTLLGALLLALAALSLTIAPPASAAGTGDPVIVTPLTDTTLDEFDGVVEVDFTDAPVGVYTLTVRTDEGSTSQQLTTTEATTEHAFQFGRVYWPNAVDVLVELAGDPSISASRSIQVTGYDEPELLSPEPRTRVTGWDGDVKLDLEGAAPGYWNISVRDEDFDYQHNTQIYYSGTNRTRVIDFPAPREDGRYRIDVSDAGGSHYASTYSFDHAVPVRVRGLSASREELYSTVRDGFRDHTKVRFELSRTARVVVRVENRNDRVRFVRDLGSLRAGTHRFFWRGKADNGTRLPVGRYRMTVAARTAAGAADKATLPLKVVSDTVPDRRTATWSGTQTDRRSKSADCYFSGYSGSLRLDCWGGRHAQATYFFRTPASARKLDWKVRGDVWCCDLGRLTRSGERVSARRYAVTVRVTNWRAYEVHRVSLTYTYDRRR